MSPEWWAAGEGQGVWKPREWGWMRGLKECGDLCDDTVVVVIPEHQHPGAAAWTRPPRPLRYGLRHPRPSGCRALPLM